MLGPLGIEIKSNCCFVAYLSQSGLSGSRIYLDFFTLWVGGKFQFDPYLDLNMKTLGLFVLGFCWGVSALFDPPTSQAPKISVGQEMDIPLSSLAIITDPGPVVSTSSHGPSSTSRTIVPTPSPLLEISAKTTTSTVPPMDFFSTPHTTTPDATAEPNTRATITSTVGTTLSQHDAPGTKGLAEGSDPQQHMGDIFFDVVSPQVPQLESREETVVSTSGVSMIFGILDSFKWPILVGLICLFCFIYLAAGGRIQCSVGRIRKVPAPDVEKGPDVPTHGDAALVLGAPTVFKSKPGTRMSKARSVVSQPKPVVCQPTSGWKEISSIEMREMVDVHLEVPDEKRN